MFKNSLTFNIPQIEIKYSAVKNTADKNTKLSDKDFLQIHLQNEIPEGYKLPCEEEGLVKTIIDPTYNLDSKLISSGNNFFKRSDKFCTNMININDLNFSDRQIISYVFNSIYYSKFFSSKNFEKLQEKSESIMLKADYMIYKFEKVIDFDFKIIKLFNKKN